MRSRPVRLSALAHVRSGVYKLVFLDLAIQRPLADAQHLGGRFAVAAGLLQAFRR